MKTKSLCLFIFLLCPILMWGQNQKISGKVISAMDNEPIIGASIIVKGTTNGAITDLDGDFQLEAKANAVLIISYVGYITQEIYLKGQTNLLIALKEDNKMLDEIGRAHV